MAQGLENRRNSQCRNYDGDIVILADDPTEQVLQGKDKTKVDQGQQDRQRAIHQRAINQQIDVVEPIAQNREPNGERDQEQGGGPDDKSNNKSPERFELR